MEQDSERALFVDVHMATLVQRVKLVMAIADELLSANKLQWEAYQNIKVAGTSQDKMRELYDALHSEGKTGKSAFYLILEKIEPDLFQELESITLTAADLLGCINEYKKWILKEYEYVTEYNSLPGENVALCDRYTQPLIAMRHSEKREREEEMCSFGESFQQLLVSRNNTDKDSSILEALFSADGRGVNPSSVILQGNSGYGKSFTAQKIMLDWASGNPSRVEIECLFHLKCKEVNHMSGDLSVTELLGFNSNLSTDQIAHILQRSPEKALILIDGFDELRFSIEDASSFPKVKYLSEKAPLEASLGALLKGHVLQESFLLVNTRSTATKTLGELLKRPQRFTELVGFSENEVNEYFRRFFQDEEHFSKAFEYVKANETLTTACSIPVICWIICTVMRERFRDEEASQMKGELETTTSIYIDFVSTLLEHHGKGLNQSVPTLLKSLGQLAERGMLDRKVLFENSLVQETTSSSPFLCRFLLKKRVRQVSMFSFMHLSFQEFFTALYYISLEEKELLDTLTERFHSQTQHYLHLYLEKEFPLKYGWPEPHFLAVVQFLFGICNKDVRNTLEEVLNLDVPAVIQPQLEEWVLDLARKGDYNFLPFILNCMYELHEEKFVQRALAIWGRLDMSWNPLSRTDCWVLVYCLNCYPSCWSLDINFAAEELKMLQRVLCRTKELGLTVQNFSDSHVTDLISAVGEGKQLLQLKLNSGCVSDQSVQQLLDALLKQKKVGGVQIGVKSISANSAVILAEFLQKKVAWEEISLRTVSVESLCSSLGLFSDDENLVLNVVRWSSSSQKQVSVSEIILRFPRAQSFSLNIGGLLQAFYRVNRTTEQNTDFEKEINALLSQLISVSGLTAVNLTVPFLTKTWASSILFLTQFCRSLEVIDFHASMWGDDQEKILSGLLLEEGIELLKESAKLSNYIVKITGLRCSKSSERCSHLTADIDELSCNQRVTIRFSGDECTEIIKDKLVLPEIAME